MADYYPVIARAVARLPENNARARLELYERARTIVLEELRKQDPKKLALEQAALEAAFLKVETESAAKEPLARAIARPPRATSAPPPTTPAPPRTTPAPPRPSAIRAAAVEAAVPAKTAPRYLRRIMQVLRPSKRLVKGPDTPAPAQSRPIAANVKRMPEIGPEIGEELGGVLTSLGAMLYGTAFLVAVMAITGVVYVRGLIWVAEGAIAYPVLLAVTAIVFALLIILPRAIFHSASTWSTFSFLSRLLYSASRRVF